MVPLGHQAMLRSRNVNLYGTTKRQQRKPHTDAEHVNH